MKEKEFEHKVLPKTKEQWHLEILKSKLESVKIEYGRLIDALIKYDIVGMATASVYFEDLFHHELQLAYKCVEASKLRKKQKEELEREILFDFFKGENSESEILKSNIKYYESLIGWAKASIKILDIDTKKKIAEDGISQQNLWSNQFDRTQKIITKIKELEKKK